MSSQSKILSVSSQELFYSLHVKMAEEDIIIEAVKETNEDEIEMVSKEDEKQGHTDAKRVTSNLSIGSSENTFPNSGKSAKKMSVTSTLSNASSDQPYIRFNRNRKVSEGLPPFISLLSQNDTGDPSDNNSNTFEIIEEESWKGQSKIYGPSGTKNFHKKITRVRKEIFPGYEQVVQDRNQRTDDDVWQEQDELQNEEVEETQIELRSKDTELSVEINNLRRSSYNQPSSPKLSERQLSSDSDLKSQFSRRGLRATVCNAQLSKQHRILNDGVSTFQHPESSAKVTRSSSMKKPFVKLLRQVVGKEVAFEEKIKHFPP